MNTVSTTKLKALKDLSIPFKFLLRLASVFFKICLFSHLGGYVELSITRLKDFIKNCRKKLQNDSNLFWVALQSNQLADVAFRGEDDLKEELKGMKEDLTKDGWILPQLEYNMRNQVNISNIKIESDLSWIMQSSIKTLKSGTNIVGHIPILLRVNDESKWKKKKDQILTHCIQEMNKKDKKNVVILHDSNWLFKDVGIDLKRLMKDKTVIEYPSSKGKQKDSSNIKDFIEKDDHILFTRKNNFNGCEASNIVFLNYFRGGRRNSLMRGVQNVILVDIRKGGEAKVSGMKEDKTFY